jgi:hypothetical protein
MEQLNDNHLQDLKASGLSDETIKVSRCHSVSQGVAKDIVGFDIGCAALAFPYHHAKPNGFPEFTRLKPDVPYQPSGWTKAAKYLSPKKSKNRLYIPPNIDCSVLQNPTADLLITEGEKKALKSIQEGFPCIAVAGVWNWRSKDESGDSRPIEDLDRVLWKKRTVFICFDSDAVTNPNVMDAESALATELCSRGALVKVIRLPEGTNKIGLDDFLTKYGADEFRKLQKAAQTPVFEGTGWRPWWYVSEKNSKRTFKPGVLADVLAETIGSLDRWEKWAVQGFPINFAKARLRSITGGASIIGLPPKKWTQRKGYFIIVPRRCPNVKEESSDRIR